MEWKFASGLRPAVRLLRRVTNASVFSIAAAVTLASAPMSLAQSAGTIIVGSDRGGFIRARLVEIQEIRARGQRVEVRGKVCFSTCTMFLGVQDMCVSPKTTFGFHGPGMALGRLTPAQFDYLSRLIASHYPQPVADWYLREGRTRTSGLYRMSGSNLIRLGVPACPTLASSKR